MGDFKLLSALGKCHHTTTGEYNFCCPLCAKRIGRPDKKFHLYVNPNKYKNGIRGWFYCHRCKAHGPLHTLVKDPSVSKASIAEWDKFKDRMKGTFVEKTERRKVSFPEDYVEMIYGTEAHKYLEDRLITREQIEFYKIGFGTQDLRKLEPEERANYAGSGRIIFPDFDRDGNCVYWVARTYKGHKIKYKNPAKSNAGDQIYNLSRAVRYQTCVIAEGVISAIACGYNGVATYGKEVTQCQVSMLVEAAFAHYFVAHDGDARKESLSLAEKLSRRGCSVSLVSFNRHEDPASVFDMEHRISSSMSMSTKNKLRFKLGY